MFLAVHVALTGVMLHVQLNAFPSVSGVHNYLTHLTGRLFSQPMCVFQFLLCVISMYDVISVCDVISVFQCVPVHIWKE